MTGSRDRGSALLLVVGATAAVSVVGLAALTAAAIRYEVVSLRLAGVQARMLAESALENAAAELAAGTLPPPAGAATTTWSGSAGPPPPGFSPLAAGCGSRVLLTLVTGGGGPRLWRTRRGAGALLIDASSEGWCGRGYHRIDTRFALVPIAGLVRLY